LLNGQIQSQKRHDEPIRTVRNRGNADRSNFGNCRPSSGGRRCFDGLVPCLTGDLFSARKVLGKVFARRINGLDKILGRNSKKDGEIKDD
jgi:hypothetical protein